MSKYSPSITEAEIPADILTKLESLPDNTKGKVQALQPQIDAALLKYYPGKTISGIAECFGVADSTIKRRIKELGL